MSSQPIPLTIIGGYLGAGKTTLINHLLRHNDGLRLAVIVNDFGKINIDAELIESQDGDTINLANGCICCTLGADLAMTLMMLVENDPPPDHILIEASGVADPAQVAQYGYMSGLRLDGVIVLADAETIRKKARDKYVGEQVVQQLRAADVLLLNKVDLVPDVTRQAVREWLKRQAPNAHILETMRAEAPLPLLLGIERDLAPSRILAARPTSSSQTITAHVHPHPDYETWSYETDQPLDGSAFRAMIDALPDGVIRAKGILHLQETPDRRTIFQLVGKRWTLTPGEPWADERPQSRVVMIGLPGSVDQGWLEARLERRRHFE